MQPSTLELMHAVLDGEATAEESRMLDRLLAADPAAQAEFDALGRLFKALDEVPPQYPPEGLVAAVATALPPGLARSGEAPQLSRPLRVVASTSSQSRGPASHDDHIEYPASRSESPRRSNHMSQQASGLFSKRTTWIGAGLAAVVAVLVAQFGFDYPRSQDVSGAIVPAERYRAPQATAADIKLGGESSVQATAPASPAAQADAANNAAQNAAQTAVQGSAQAAAQNSAQRAMQGAAQTAAQTAAQGSAQAAAQNSAQRAMQGAAQTSAQGAAQSAAQTAAQGSAQAAAQNSAQRAMQGAAQTSAQGAAQSAAQTSAQGAAQAAAQNSAQRAAQTSAQGAAQTAAQAAAQNAAQGAANGAVK